MKVDAMLITSGIVNQHLADLVSDQHPLHTLPHKEPGQGHDEGRRADDSDALPVHPTDDAAADNRRRDCGGSRKAVMRREKHQHHRANS